MSEAPSMKPDLSCQTQFRLNKINEIKNYFIKKIQERGTMNKRLTKYIVGFDYFEL